MWGIWGLCQSFFYLLSFFYFTTTTLFQDKKLWAQLLKFKLSARRCNSRVTWLRSNSEMLFLLVLRYSTKSIWWEAPLWILVSGTPVPRVNRNHRLWYRGTRNFLVSTICASHRKVTLLAIDWPFIRSNKINLSIDRRYMFHTQFSCYRHVIFFYQYTILFT